MSNVLYILAGVYIIAMGYFLKTVPGESGPFIAGDERVKQQATPVRRLIVIALGLLMLVYGVFEVVQAREHREHTWHNANAPTSPASGL